MSSPQFVQRDGRRFVIGDQEFKFVGFNIRGLAHYGIISILLGLVSAGFTLYGFTVNGVLPIGTSLLVVLFFVMGGFWLLTAVVLWALRSWMESLQAVIERKS